MKRNKKTALTVAVGSAIAASLAGAPLATAADNPFSAESLGAGYMVASNHEKTKEGKCGEGKCGGMKAKGDATKAEAGTTTAEKAKEGKCGEGKCGGAKAKEGKCGAKK